MGVVPPESQVLAAVEAAWTAAYGEVVSRGSVSFVGVATIDVLRFGLDSAGLVHYATLGMSRQPMGDPAAVAFDPTVGPRAELCLALADRRDSVLRTLAVLASAPAVEGLVLAPDGSVELGQPLWDGSEFTAVLVDEPVLPDVRTPDPTVTVRLLPVVPMTATELAFRRVNGAAALRNAWREAGTDLTAASRRTG